MWSVSKEGFILLAAVAALAVLGLALWIFSPDPPPIAPEVAPVVAPASEAAEVTPVVVQPAPAAASPEPDLAPAIDGIIQPGEYAHQTESTGFEIHWSNDQRVLRMGLVSPGTGYLAIGFDPESRMQGANFILGAVIDGRTVVRDDYGTGSVHHASDVSLGGRDNVLSFAGTEADGKATLEFAIPLDSGDAYDKRLVPGTSVEILIAYHETDDDFSAWHGRWGRGFIVLDPE